MFIKKNSNLLIKSVFLILASLPAAGYLSAAPVVSGNTISWPDDGWYQVQSANDYVSLCEGGTSCVVTAGSYIVINHTTGERFENIVVDTALPLVPPKSITVIGATITWPDNGWYQVQSASDYTSICEGGLSCSVEPGTYIVINHTSGLRVEGIVVGTDHTNAAAPMVSGHTISWEDNGWYQVQTADDYRSICEGGISCVVSEGDYIVINHTTAERFEVTVAETASVPVTEVKSSNQPVGPISRLDVSSRITAEGYQTFSLLSMTRDGSNLLLRHRQPTNSVDVQIVDYLSYDRNSEIFIPLVSVPSSHSMAVAPDGSVAAFVDGCLAYIQDLSSMSVPVPINDLLRENACARQVQISQSGKVAVFSLSQGLRTASGELVFAASGGNQYAYAAYSFESASIVSIARDDSLVGDAALDSLNRSSFEPQLSNDGRYMVSKVYFRPDQLFGFNEIDYSVGTLLTNTQTGEIRLIGRHDYHRIVCARCSFDSTIKPVISGNGAYVFYTMPVESVTNQTLGATRLFRYDVASGESEQFPETSDLQVLVSANNGERIAYRVDGKVYVGFMESGEVLSTDESFRFCQNGTCEFDSYRFVNNNPLTISGDGSSLLVKLIPSRLHVDGPQNTQELFLVDISAKVAQRVAPDADASFVHISDDGAVIAFKSATPNLVAGDDGFSDDIFIVERN